MMIGMSREKEGMYCLYGTSTPACFAARYPSPMALAFWSPFPSFFIRYLQSLVRVSFVSKENLTVCPIVVELIFVVLLLSS